MKLKLFLFIAIAMLASCASEEIDETHTLNPDLELESRSSCEGCPTMTVINRRDEPGEQCCTFSVNIVNNSSCEYILEFEEPDPWGNSIQIIYPGYNRTLPTRPSCCGEDEGVTMTLVSINNSGERVVCDVLELSCCEEESCEPCTIDFYPEDLGTDVQIVGRFSLSICRSVDEPSARYDLCDGIAVLYRNESDCSDEELADIVASNYPFHQYEIVYRKQYGDCLQDELRSIEGCEDSEVRVRSYGPGELHYQIDYNCETCRINHFNVLKYGFNPEPTCDKIEFGTFISSNRGSSGPVDCGPCAN